MHLDIVLTKKCEWGPVSNLPLRHLNFPTKKYDSNSINDSRIQKHGTKAAWVSQTLKSPSHLWEQGRPAYRPPGAWITQSGVKQRLSVPPLPHNPQAALEGGKAQHSPGPQPCPCTPAGLQAAHSLLRLQPPPLLLERPGEISQLNPTLQLPLQRCLLSWGAPPPHTPVNKQLSSRTIGAEQRDVGAGCLELGWICPLNPAHNQGQERCSAHCGLAGEFSSFNCF